MKKIFTIVAMAAMLMACGGNEEDPQNKPGNKPGPGDEVQYEAPIKADGNFADWDALDASKVSVATLPEGLVKYDGLTTLKVYADEMYVYAYIEFDDVVIADKKEVPFHFYLNADNSDATGGGDDIWTDCDAEWLFEGFIFEGGEFCSYDPSIYDWRGEVGVADWAWAPEEEVTLPSGSGVSSGAGSGNAYEFAIMREMLPFELEDTFTLGVDIQQDWNSVGMLPCGVITDEDSLGTATKLVVNVDK